MTPASSVRPIAAPVPSGLPVAADKKELARGSYASYESGRNVLRAWLAAYSIGVPALILTTSSLREELKKHGTADSVMLLFGSAIALQVAITWFNKYTQWGTYAFHADPPEITRFTKLCDRVSSWIWIDCAVDLSSMVALVWGSAVAYRSVF
jgi:hypothetical protein